MPALRHVPRRLLFVLAIALLATSPVAAQTVTGSISGLVTDDQGGVLPGADVVAVHEPTGTTYEAITGPEGRFQFLNVRVGGPYILTVRLAGFREQVQRDVNVALGEDTSVTVKLPLESVTETITVTAESSPIFTGSRAGTTGSVGTEQIETLPTISRSLQDFARTNPFVVQTQTNALQSTLSIAGRSGRYNNVQIDGAVNNDLFGLADTGTPGGPAETEPISLDAIQELQIVVSPYDVRQGGFSGGGVNAITRGGTNRVRGTAYYFFRDQDWVGKGPENRPIATFSDKQFGGSVGGPLVQNKAFFFGNLDMGRNETPTGWSIDGSSGQAFGRVAEANRLLSILQTRYGYNPGGFEEYIRPRDNDKFFVRGDFNIGRHQLTVRHNYVKGILSKPGSTPSTSLYLFPDQYYDFNSKTNSTVGQLNSTFGQLYNEFRVSYQRIRDFRDPPGRFPQVNVRLPGGGNFRFGTEQFSTANELDQDMIELHNDLTMVRGKHSFTFGTHNEFFKFRNLFIRDNFGTYDFADLDLFDAGLAQAYMYSFSSTSDPRESARFWVYQLGFYAGDQWRIAPRFTLTYGVRLDLPIFPDTPANNPRVEQLYGVRTDVTPDTQTWSPRVGFNWDLTREAIRQQLRGGIGYFGGRTPYVWLSNQYTNTGLEFTRISATFNNNLRIPFVADPDAQPTSVPGVPLATNEVNLIDPDYSYPKLIRANLGYDRSLGFQGLIGSVELLYSKTVQDIDYRNFNMVPVRTLPDGRPVYGRANPAYSDVVFLTNTSKGDSWNLALKLDRPFRNRWFASASYLYGRSRTVNDGGSSQARSNWINNKMAFDVNNVPLGISNFDPGHRITMSGSYRIPLGPTTATVSLFYNGQSGRPYAFQFFQDVNNDGSSTNDLFYIPATASEVQVTGGTFEQLMAFIDGLDCSDLPTGGIADRNTCRAPWTNTLDFRTAFDVRFGRYSGEITLDLLNVINMFDRQKGLVEFVTFNGLALAGGGTGGTINPSGQWVYNLSNEVIQNRPYSRDDLRSRWQAQLGFRFRF